jgi:hypothetical protein
MPSPGRRRREPVVGRNGRGRNVPAERQLSTRAAFSPDIEFLARQGISERVLVLATDLAASRGTAPSEELLAAGFDPRLYWSLLAADLGLEFIRDMGRAKLLPHAGLQESDALGRAASALIAVDERVVLAVAPPPDEIPLLRRRLQESRRSRAAFASPPLR